MLDLLFKIKILILIFIPIFIFLESGSEIIARDPFGATEQTAVYEVV